jgi:hypothetical protein
MFQRLLGIACICATLALFFSKQDPGFGKVSLIREADIILIGTITQVTQLQSQDLLSWSDYKYRGEVTTEYPIKGTPVQYFPMYCNSAKSTFGSGRALIFLKKDMRGNLIAFRPYICVIPISNNDILWSNDDSLKLVEKMQLGSVIGDIKKIAGISAEKQKSLAEFISGKK